MESCPIVIEDLEYGIFCEKGGNKIYCIGSREVDRYFFVSDRLFADCKLMISYLKGEYTIKEINQLMNAECKEGFDVDYTYNILLQNNLIKNVKYEGKRQFNEFDLIFKTIASFDISNLIKRVCKIPALYRMSISLLMLFVDIYAIFLITFNNIDLEWTMIVGNPITIVFFMILSTVSVLLHEISHAIAAEVCGLSIKRLSFTTIAYTSFGAYVKVPGIYFLPPYKRICIWFSGIYTNIFLLSIAIIGLNHFDGYMRLFVLVLGLANVTLIYSSIIPFYLLDGYFILTTILKIPNLRRNSFFNLKKIIIEKRFNRIYFIYSLYLLMATIFSVIILYKILMYIFIDIHKSFKSSVPVLQIILNYKNFFLILLLSILGRVIYKRVFKEKS